MPGERTSAVSATAPVLGGLKRHWP